MILLLVSIAGCGEKRLPAVPEQGIILAFGDSLTAGVGVNKPQSYPSVLGELSRRQVVNAGVSGETTAAGLARLAGVLAETRPDLLVLLEGGNDILRNQNPAATKQNLAAMIKLAQNQGVPVVLIGVPEKRLFSDSAGFYRELAEEYELVFDGELLAGLLRKPAYKSDAVHLNEAGYRVMAEAIHQLLIDNGAL